MPKLGSLKLTLVSQKASNANSERGIIQLHLILLLFFCLGNTDAQANIKLISIPSPSINATARLTLKNLNSQIAQVTVKLGQQEISQGHGLWQLSLKSA